MLTSSSASSRFFAYAIPGLVGFIVVLLAFWLGTAVGERRMRHFSGWCEGYRHAFLPPRGREQGLFPRLPNAHGVFGRVVSVSGQTLIIEGNDDVEQSVQVSSSTAIRIGHRAASWEEIRVDGQVSVFGMPNGQGQIEARLIRLLPTTTR